jgi:hypothetical protein
MVFNFYGYRLVISYLQKNHVATMEAQIDEQKYNEADLISIKTTLNLPYYTSSPAFERAYGSVTIDGVSYEYVKRRIYNDTLELLCLPNHRQSALNAVSSEIAKGVADGASLPAKKTITIKVLLPDFFTESSTSLSPVAKVSDTPPLPLLSPSLIAGYRLLPDHPPQISTASFLSNCI